MRCLSVCVVVWWWFQVRLCSLEQWTLPLVCRGTCGLGKVSSSSAVSGACVSTTVMWRTCLATPVSSRCVEWSPDVRPSHLPVHTRSARAVSATTAVKDSSVTAPTLHTADNSVVKVQTTCAVYYHVMLCYSALFIELLSKVLHPNWHKIGHLDLFYMTHDVI